MGKREEVAYPTTFTNAQNTVTEIIAAHLNALEVKLGIDSDPNTNSIDYKIQQALIKGNNLSDVSNTRTSKTNLKIYQYHIGDFNDDLSAAITAIGGTAKRLVIDKSISLSANTTVPANVHLYFTEEGRIAKNGFTLAINGKLTVGLWQIFSGFSAGNVTISGKSCMFVFPQWWGAVPDNSTDSTVAIQCAIDCNHPRIAFSGGPGAGIGFMTTSTVQLGNGHQVPNLYGDKNTPIYTESDIPIITVDTGAGDIYYLNMEDLFLQSGCGGRTWNSKGIFITGNHSLVRSKIKGIHSRGNYYGLYVYNTVIGTQWSKFDDFLCDNYNFNTHYMSMRWDAPCGLCKFTDIMSQAVYGLYFTKGFGDSIVSSFNHDGGNVGFYADKGAGSYSAFFCIDNSKFDNTAQPITLVGCENFRALGNAYLGNNSRPVQVVNCANYVIDTDQMSGINATGAVILGENTTGGNFAYFVKKNIDTAGWSTVLTMTKNVSSVWTAAVIRATISGCQDGSTGSVRLSKWILVWSDTSFGASVIGADEVAGGSAAQFRIGTSGSTAEIQVAGSNGSSNFKGAIMLEILAPAKGQGGQTPNALWGIS
jgi:hypothetical protein